MKAPLIPCDLHSPSEYTHTASLWVCVFQAKRGCLHLMKNGGVPLAEALGDAAESIEVLFFFLKNTEFKTQLQRSKDIDTSS